MHSLGNYSAYSFHEAAWSVERLVAAAKAAGYAGVGLADRGGVYGGVALSQACEREGLRMVLGARVQLRDFEPGWVQLTVRTATGYGRLCRFLSEVPAGETDLSHVAALMEAAPADLWLSLPVRGRHRRASRIGLFARWRSAVDAFLGPETRAWAGSVWFELGWANEAERQLQRRVFAEWQRRGWERWVVMTGARHDDGPQQRQLLETVQAIGTLTRLGEPHPDKLLPGDYSLLQAGAVEERYVRVPEVLQATERFADGCRFDFRYGTVFLPNPLVERGATVAEQSDSRRRQERLLARRCLRGLRQRYGKEYPWRDKPSREQLRARLRRELGVVAETGYAGYFLIFAEVVDTCAEREIPVLARGSAAGSLICYTLGVSNVCPFRFGLCFERFLNPERLRHSKLPDIDLDLPWDRRDEIMSWLYDRYGLDRVAMIGGFAHYKGRAAVAEVAKAMGVVAHEAHAWSKQLPHGSLRKFLRDREDFVEAKGAWKDDRFREAVELAAELDGLPRHPMMHPCGMVIADRDLRDFTPVGGSAKGFSMTQLSMDPIEDLGLLKLDLLGQAGLSVLRDCFFNLREEVDAGRLSSVEGGPDPRNPLEGVDYGDARIYERVRAGEARGVFHIESPAMTSLLKLCRCADIDCLVATVSVIRPGAANEAKKTRYARRYLGLEAPRFAHPSLVPVLEDSYGLLIYEEHILLVAHHFAGMDLGTADLLRRILIKKSDETALAELEAVFRACALREGRSLREIETVWHELRDFSGFMFNKAHGAAYAVEAFHGCWLKAHWPVHYLAAVLNNRRGFYQPLVYVLEILRHGGSFRLPDVQASSTGYRVEGGAVQVPLWQIKGLSENFLERWAAERKRRPFANWADLVHRTRLRRSDAEVLARVGALRSFFSNRNLAVWEAGCLRERPAGRGSGDLFATVPREAVLPDSDPAQAAEAEAELLGYPVSLDPFSLWMPETASVGTVPVVELPAYVGREVNIAGLQVCHRLHRTHEGGLMKFVSVADSSGIAETVLFPEAYRAYGWQLSQERSARLRVFVEWDETESGLSLTVTEAGF
jgi:DNA-directed DNA polymerase III PolC